MATPNSPAEGQAAQAQVQAPQVNVPKFEPKRRAEDSAKRKGPFVKYVGEASERIIRPHHWKATKGVGENVKDDKATHKWSIHNDKMIESSEFSDEQLDYLLCDDMQPRAGGHSFVEVDYDADGNLAQVTE